MSEPKIISFFTHQKKYYVLGMETKTPNGTVGDWGARWRYFFSEGLDKKIEPYKVDNALLGLFCQSEPGYYNYLIGAMVGEGTEIPEGIFYQTFPESDYFVVTHEWVDNPDQADEQIGRIVGAAHDGSVPLPDGLEKYTNPVMFIERYNYKQNDKCRFEVWLAIRKK
ncbi:MAG: GyrI-like domain-containing protein [Eubacteriales bacterium]